MQDLIQAIMPALLLLADHLLELVLGLAVMAFYRWTGILIEEKHMRALHSAAVTGVRLAMEGKAVGPAIAEVALNHMRSSVPDAIRKLAGGNESVLMRIIQAKLNEIKSE